MTLFKYKLGANITLSHFELDCVRVFKIDHINVFRVDFFPFLFVDHSSLPQDERVPLHSALS